MLLNLKVRMLVDLLFFCKIKCRIPTNKDILKGELYKNCKIRNSNRCARKPLEMIDCN